MSDDQEMYQDLTEPRFDYIVDSTSSMRPKTGQQVNINYKVQIARNKSEGNYVDQGQDFKFVLGDGEVIPGMEWAVNEMKKGDIIMAYLPWSMGYGESGMPPRIPAKSDLVFEIELKGFGKKKAQSSEASGEVFDDAKIKELSEKYVHRRIHMVKKLEPRKGTIRYIGKLQNNPKAKDSLWMGIEWDVAGQGTHQGEVDGVRYFEQLNTPLQNEKGELNNCCSFIRYGSIKIDQETLALALKEKHNAQMEFKAYMDAKAKETDVDFQMVGMDGIKDSLEAMQESHEVCLDEKLIWTAEESIPGNLNALVPQCRIIELENNLLYSWDQYFFILSELPHLTTINISGNILKRFTKSYFEENAIEKLKHDSLQIAVFMNMRLDPEQLEALTYTFSNLQTLILSQNNMHALKPNQDLQTQNLQSLKRIVMDKCQLTSFEQMRPFAFLPKLEEVTINNNQISDFNYIDGGFQNLTYFHLTDCLIESYRVFDNFGRYPSLTHLNWQRNTLHNQSGEYEAMWNTIARIPKLAFINKSEIFHEERTNCYVQYCDTAYLDFLKTVLKLESGNEQVSLEDPRIVEYMTKEWPRFFDLIKFLNYTEVVHVAIVKEKEDTIKNKSVMVNLVCHGKAQEGNEKKKKLLGSMTVNQLKSLCAKIFKIELIKCIITVVYEDFHEVELHKGENTISYYEFTDDIQVHVYQKGYSVPTFSWDSQKVVKKNDVLVQIVEKK